MQHRLFLSIFYIHFYLYKNLNYYYYYSSSLRMRVTELIMRAIFLAALKRLLAAACLLASCMLDDCVVEKRTKLLLIEIVPYLQLQTSTCVQNDFIAATAETSRFTHLLDGATFTTSPCCLFTQLCSGVFHESLAG